MGLILLIFGILCLISSFGYQLVIGFNQPQNTQWIGIILIIISSFIKQMTMIKYP
jgi:divalent metal cation (Fe/Co/Zn/Cd) transporter